MTKLTWNNDKSKNSFSDGGESIWIVTMLISSDPCLESEKSEKKIKVAMAVCILHNICIMENDNVDYFLRKARRRVSVKHNTNKPFL